MAIVAWYPPNATVRPTANTCKAQATDGLRGTFARSYIGDGVAPIVAIERGTDYNLLYSSILHTRKFRCPLKTTRLKTLVEVPVLLPTTIRLLASLPTLLARIPMVAPSLAINGGSLRRSGRLRVNLKYLLVSVRLLSYRVVDRMSGSRGRLILSLVVTLAVITLRCLTVR